MLVLSIFFKVNPLHLPKILVNNFKELEHLLWREHDV